MTATDDRPPGGAGVTMTTSKCPKCKKPKQGVNGRYRCPDDETLWSTNPEDGGVRPVFFK